MRPAPRRLLLSIGALSALILFAEMLLIRWVATEIRIFAYLQNGVLVAAFLGLGLGARSARGPARLLPAVVAWCAIALFVRDPLGWGLGERVTAGLATFQRGGIWATGASASGSGWTRLAAMASSLVVTLVLLAAVALVFRPLGQWLGRWMDAHPRPIAAYSANILGSLAGIVLFDAATLGHLPPAAWLTCAAAGLLPLAPLSEEPRWARVAAGLLAVALPLAALRGGDDTLWSPYQKLSVLPLYATSTGLAGPTAAPQCGWQVHVNGTNYMAMVDLDPARQAAAPSIYPPDQIRRSHYVLPYEVVGAPGRVLVVGAGAGNDVAGALRAGATSVHAVEIDPLIVELGRRLHPSAPYASPRVQVTIDDARAFFQRDTGRYDLVWFGLLDSHTTPSAYTNVRLDHFVYTQESFAAVRRLMTPDGVLALFFASESPWISLRLAGLMQHTFGATPLVMPTFPETPCMGWGGVLLLGGAPATVARLRARVEADPGLSRYLFPDVSAWVGGVTPSTDDWPYLYLERPSLPPYHLVMGAACLLLGVALRRRLFQPGEEVDGALLLLGAGFMLLEVAGVSRAALLFGTTWTVNAYVVGAILGMALLANLVAARWPVPPTGWPFAGLLLSLLALALVPTALLAGLPLAARVVVGGAFLALPVFFAGLVFVTLWAGSGRRDLALGSNLLGALLGGVASMLSMVVGFRALAILTLLVYAGALLVARREGRRPRASLP